jgi:hypothetical protein
MTGYLAHYGVKGMKWGVWNSETATRYGAKGGILPKGSVVTRVSTSKEDPTYFNKKHVSTTRSDHDEWVEYLGSRYRDRGINTYDVVYSTTKDLKIASAKELGKTYTDTILQNSKYSERAKEDVKKAEAFLGIPINTKNASLTASAHLAAQTKTGKQLIDNLLSAGYGGTADKHGQDTAKDPLIIFNPDRNLAKDSVYYGKYWSPYGSDFAPKEKKTYD